jgi:Ser/Thr protein kinase RdoA (MazF antagonist)
MNIFPTQYSTLSSPALKDKLQESYSLNNITCRLLIRNVSDTYILENESSKYIFKIYRNAHRKIEEINGEVELLNALKELGAQVSYPIKDINGSHVQAFNAAEGIRHGVLFSFAPGSVIYNMSDEQLDRVGKEMAVIHNITSGLDLNFARKEYSLITTIIEPLKILKPAFIGLEEEYNWLNNKAQVVMEKLQQFDLQQFSYGYCHYDFFPKNFHFTPDGKITFFDFDFAGKGYLAYDITSFYIHYFLESSFNKITREEADRAFNKFVASYRKVRPLADQELEAIPYLGFAFWIFYLGFQYENFDDWSNTFFGPKFIKDRVTLIKKWLDSFETLQ